MKKTKSNSEEVIIFGNSVNTEHSHHETSADFGIFLIFVGTILFLNTLEIISWEVWDKLLPLWPVLIILLGINLFFGRGRIARFIYILINLIVFGSLFLFVLIQFAPHLAAWLPDEITNYILLWEAITI